MKSVHFVGFYYIHIYIQDDQKVCAPDDYSTESYK
jgi:hypothetical protein